VRFSFWSKLVLWCITATIALLVILDSMHSFFPNVSFISFLKQSGYYIYHLLAH